jgi:hypothetical protein
MVETSDRALDAKLALLRQLYEEGDIDEATFRARLSKLGIDPDTALPPPPAPPLPAVADLRQRLDRLDDAQIEALAIDQFPEVRRKFGGSGSYYFDYDLLIRWTPESKEILSQLW